MGAGAVYPTGTKESGGRLTNRCTLPAAASAAPTCCRDLRCAQLEPRSQVGGRVPSLPYWLFPPPAPAAACLRCWPTLLRLLQPSAAAEVIGLDRLAEICKAVSIPGVCAAANNSAALGRCAVPGCPLLLWARPG